MSKEIFKEKLTIGFEIEGIIEVQHLRDKLTRTINDTGSDELLDEYYDASDKLGEMYQTLLDVIADSPDVTVEQTDNYLLHVKVPVDTPDLGLSQNERQGVEGDMIFWIKENFGMSPQAMVDVVPGFAEFWLTFADDLSEETDHICIPSATACLQFIMYGTKQFNEMYNHFHKHPI